MGKCLSHEGGALINEISALIKVAPGSSLPPSTMSGHSKKAPAKSQKESLREKAGALILYFPASRTVRDKFLFISYPVCVFCYSSLNGLRHILTRLLGASSKKHATNASYHIHISLHCTTVFCCFQFSSGPLTHILNTVVLSFQALFL